MTSTQVAAEQELLETQRRRFDAVVGHDYAVLDQLFADDLTYVHTSARLETKPEFIAALREDRIFFKAIDTEDVRIRLYTDVGLITGIARITLRGREQDTVLRVRFQDVWARTGGRWREVAWQTTRFPESQP